MRKVDRSNNTEYEVRQFRKQTKQLRKLRQRGDRGLRALEQQNGRYEKMENTIENATNSDEGVEYAW